MEQQHGKDSKLPYVNEDDSQSDDCISRSRFYSCTDDSINNTEIFYNDDTETDRTTLRESWCYRSTAGSSNLDMSELTQDLDSFSGDEEDDKMDEITSSPEIYQQACHVSHTPLKQFQSSLKQKLQPATVCVNKPRMLKEKPPMFINGIFKKDVSGKYLTTPIHSDYSPSKPSQWLKNATPESKLNVVSGYTRSKGLTQISVCDRTVYSMIFANLFTINSITLYFGREVQLLLSLENYPLSVSLLIASSFIGICSCVGGFVGDLNSYFRLFIVKYGCILWIFSISCLVLHELVIHEPDYILWISFLSCICSYSLVYMNVLSNGADRVHARYCNYLHTFFSFSFGISCVVPSILQILVNSFISDGDFSPNAVYFLVVVSALFILFNICCLIEMDKSKFVIDVVDDPRKQGVKLTKMLKIVLAVIKSGKFCTVVFGISVILLFVGLFLFCWVVSGANIEVCVASLILVSITMALLYCSSSTILLPEKCILSNDNEETNLSMGNISAKDLFNFLTIVPVFCFGVFGSFIRAQSLSTFILQACQTNLSLFDNQVYFNPEYLLIVLSGFTIIFLGIFTVFLLPLLRRYQIQYRHVDQLSTSILFFLLAAFFSGIMELYRRSGLLQGHSAELSDQLWFFFPSNCCMKPIAVHFSVLWLIPQLICIAIGEVCFKVSMGEFLYINARENETKATSLGCLELANSVGSLGAVLLVYVMLTYYADYSEPTDLVLIFLSFTVLGCIVYAAVKSFQMQENNKTMAPPVQSS